MKNPDYYYEGEPRYIPQEYKDQSFARQSDYEKLIIQLENRITELESRSGLMSKSWINRVFTTWVYFLIAQVMICLVVLVLGMIFSLLN